MERPIIFSTEMVKAILDGRKTQTRRVVKPQPINVPNGAYIDPYNHNYNSFTVWTSDNKMCLSCGGDRKNMAHWRSPYGKPGDLLWVRERFRQAYAKTKYSEGIIYYADKYRAMGMGEYSDRHKWLQSIHMPKEYARIWLKVKDIRVERVQDISQEDAVKEGIILPKASYYDPGDCPDIAPSDIFTDLWGSINKKRGYGWDVNPWVWVVEFEKIVAQ